MFREAYFNLHHRHAIINEFKALYQGDMTVTEYYNQFIELSQYYLMRNENSPSLISKFMSRLQPAISDKIVEHRFTLMNCYASHSWQMPTLRVEMLSVPAHVTLGITER